MRAAPATSDVSTSSDRPPQAYSIEIPPQDWRNALDEFTGVHAGWLVSLDVLSADLGAQREFEDLRLLGVSADPVEDNGSIGVSVTSSQRQHLTHYILAVQHVHLERTGEGADVALQFESADGTRTILRFRTAVPAETVDGIAPFW